MDEEIKRILENHEKRIKTLEGTPSNQKKQKINKSYVGLNGGIRKLIDEGFLDEPRFFKEIIIELKRNGYHYPRTSLSKALTNYFMKSWQLIHRFKEDNNWKYIVRK